MGMSEPAIFDADFTVGRTRRSPWRESPACSRAGFVFALSFASGCADQTGSPPSTQMQLASAHGATEPVVRTSGGGAATVPPRAVQATDRDMDFPGIHFRDGKVASARIHYSTAGTPHRDMQGQIDNAVLMLHWTGASGDALQSRAFADALYAVGRPLDLATHFLVFIDALGHGRSSKPSDGLHARFPAYGYDDIVELQYRVITEGLGLTHLHAIVGLSMGGMNAWQWAERYPDFMDAIIPVVALPAPVAGRNLLWRRFVIHQIRSDPSWANGEYRSPPRGWVEAFPIFRMMLDGVPRLQDVVHDRASADAYIAEASAQAEKMDANDVLYSLEASSDYDPSAHLEQIHARVYALNFSDDEINPAELGVLESGIRRVPRATLVVQPGNARSFGHFTQAHPELWAERIGGFLRALDQGSP